jgi:hypothetical protein
MLDMVLYETLFHKLASSQGPIVALVTDYKHVRH